jgi:periplasmic divalent cation tolerance protein
MASSTGASLSLLFTTAPTKELARKIALHLVEKRLVACVNIIPGVESVYIWENKVQSDDEVILKMKTTANNVAEVAKEIKSLHTYQTFELISIPIADGSKDYLEWIHRSVKQE